MSSEVETEEISDYVRDYSSTELIFVESQIFLSICLNFSNICRALVEDTYEKSLK